MWRCNSQSVCKRLCCLLTALTLDITHLNDLRQGLCALDQALDNEVCPARLLHLHLRRHCGPAAANAAQQLAGPIQQQSQQCAEHVVPVGVLQDFEHQHVERLRAGTGDACV